MKIIKQQPDTRCYALQSKNDYGGIFPFVLMVIVGLILLAHGLIYLGQTSGSETGRTVGAGQAFWAADAGIEHALAIAFLNKERYGSAEAFPASNPRTLSGVTGAGAAYEVQVTQTNTDPPSYHIVSDGRSRGGAIRSVELVLSQVSAISLGFFGNSELYIKPGSGIYSYDFNPPTPQPTPEQSTGQAVIGSNTHLTLQVSSDFVLDGSVSLGADETGEESADTKIVPIGAEDLITQEEIGYIDPDPLRLFGDPTVPGNLAYDFANAQITNDNGDIFPADKLKLSGKQELTLTAGSYYLTSADMGSHTILNVDLSAGQVLIYLSGSFYAGPQTTINVTGGKPTDFRIYANSEPRDNIIMQPQGDVSAFIYAPRMEVQIKPKGDFYGAVWADDAQIWPNGEVYIDTSILEYNALGVYRLARSGWHQMPTTN